MDDDDHIESHDDGPDSSFTHEEEVLLHDGEQPITVSVHLECTSFSEAPSGRNEHYDPGGPAEFELSYAEVSVGSDTAKLTSELYWALLGDKAQIVYDKAVEAAQDSGDF